MGCLFSSVLIMGFLWTTVFAMEVPEQENGKRMDLRTPYMNEKGEHLLLLSTLEELQQLVNKNENKIEEDHWWGNRGFSTSWHGMNISFSNTPKDKRLKRFHGPQKVNLFSGSYDPTPDEWTLRVVLVFSEDPTGTCDGAQMSIRDKRTRRIVGTKRITTDMSVCLSFANSCRFETSATQVWDYSLKDPTPPKIWCTKSKISESKIPVEKLSPLRHQAAIVVRGLRMTGVIEDDIDSMTLPEDVRSLLSTLLEFSLTLS